MPDREELPQALPPGRYVAVQHGEQGDRELGLVRLDEDGTMTPEAVEQTEGSDLARIAQAMNKKQVLHVDVFPPPDAPRFAMASRIVPRGDQDFVPALLQQLARYYKLQLRAA